MRFAPSPSLSLSLPLVAFAVLAVASVAALAEPKADEQRTLASVKDCELRYRVYPGHGRADGPAAVIAHGFLRNGSFMAGWAEAIARSGTTAVTIDLCASTAPGGRHADNGADLVAVRRELGIDAVIYVGVSAGGLAALVAASQDPEATRGLLLLDPTNAGGQARSAAGRVRAPVAALVARPQLCNAWRNIDPALHALRDATIVPIEGATHCNFEWPTDNFCRIACLATRDDERQRRSESRIRRIALGFVEAVSRDDADALAEWKSGLADALR